MKKIALVHDYLNEAGGAERVLKVLSEMYPEAPIYTAFKKKGTAILMFNDRKVYESKWGWVLKIGRLYSYLRFCLPWIWKSLDLRDYDIVITSCSGYIARGFRVREDARVIAYCHTPPRWLYGYETPTGAGAKWWGRLFMFIVGPIGRYFDFKSAERVDAWMANSKEVAGRIAKFYRKKAVVVYPPIPEVKKEEEGERDNYYLIVSRIVGGKGIIEAVAAAKELKLRLKVVGEIVGEIREEDMRGSGIEYMGRVSDLELAQLYAKAKGFIALSRDEDFGMTLVEAMSYGTPVLAYNGGGYRETVVEEKTGILINGVSPKEIAEGIKQMEKITWKRAEIKKWAARFSRESFEKGIRGIVNKYV